MRPRFASRQPRARRAALIRAARLRAFWMTCVARMRRPARLSRTGGALPRLPAAPLPSAQRVAALVAQLAAEGAPARALWVAGEHAQVTRLDPALRDARLPLPRAGGAAACLPLLRQGRRTLVWPLATAATPHLLVAGDGLPLLRTALAALAPGSSGALLVHDPARRFAALAHDDGALAAARLHTLQQRWRAADPSPPLLLLVVHPDEVAWRDLLPLLLAPFPCGVTALVLCDPALACDAARAACHQLPVVEVGSGAPLPASHRPPGVEPPRAGEVVAWQTARHRWRGTLPA